MKNYYTGELIIHRTMKQTNKHRSDLGEELLNASIKTVVLAGGTIVAIVAGTFQVAILDAGVTFLSWLTRDKVIKKNVMKNDGKSCCFKCLI